MSKYFNKKTEVDGMTFDSKAEAARYGVLKLELRNGDINDLTFQPRFELLKAGTNAMGNKYRKIEYVADFQYYDVGEGKWVVEDVKGFATSVYKIKKKLFFFHYPEFYFQEIS